MLIPTRFLLLLALLLGPAGRATCQHLTWASSGQEISLAWNYAAVGPNDFLVVGGHQEPLREVREEPVLLDGQGNSIAARFFDENELIVCLTPSGSLSWQVELRARFFKLCGIAAHKSGDTYALLLATPELADQYNDADDLGILAPFARELSRDNRLQPGYYLAAINPEGQIRTLTPCNLNDQARIKVDALTFHPNGQLLLCGSLMQQNAKISPALGAATGAAGGDFVLMLGLDGKPAWADVIAYTGNVCCAGVAEQLSLAVDAQGTVYLGGTYIAGARFGGQTTKLAPPDPARKPPFAPEESYLAAYSAAGKLRWVTTARTRGRLQRVAANGRHIAVGFKAQQASSLFGLRLDSASRQPNIICFFNKQGKPRKAIAPNASIEDMSFGKGDTLYVLGINNQYNYQNPKARRWFFAQDSLEPRANITIAAFSPTGALHKLRTADAPVESSNEPFRLLLDSRSNFYLYGQLFVSRPLDLSIYDRAFKAGKLYGGTPFIARKRNQ